MSNPFASYGVDGITTFNPGILENESLSLSAYINNMNGSGTNSKLFWQNHWDPNGEVIVANSNYGAKCKVEVISRSDLLRARGFKVGSLEANTESD